MRAVEAIYENGKLDFLEKIDGIKKAKAVVVFIDEEKKQKKKRAKLTAEKLPEVRFSGETMNEYRKKLDLAEEREENIKKIDMLQDTFFSLEPVDLGYTNANSLDSLIADEAMRKKRS